jgi:DDE superfamily endonuclease
VGDVAAAHPGEEVEVWFEDEARFGQQGTLTAVWAEKGSRPTAPKQVGYASLHVLTAVCPATGRAEGLISERLDAGIVQRFLDQLSATIPAGVHAALVWDGAGWHTASSLRVPANLTLIALPPYSPELSVVERLWRYLRGHHGSNRVYGDAEALEEAAVTGWRAVCLNPGTIKTVCRCEYAENGS